MAEVETAALAAAAAAEEPVVSAKEEAPPAKETETPEEEEEAAGETSEANDHKRKMEDLELHENEGAPQKKQEVSSPRPTIEISAANEAGSDGVQNATPVSGNHTSETQAVVADVVSLDGGQSTDTIAAVDVKADGEQPPLDGETAADGGHEVSKLEAPAMGNGQHPSAENLQKLTGVVSQEGSLPSGGQQPSLELSMSSRKIEVPNNKVGVLIGKSGDIIRNLQTHSGAKIQITRDAEADPYSSTRLVELIGTLENINKAEQLIKDVIAEADAGGSPALVARGFNTAQSGGEQTEIQVPNEKVGLIIGKGGETIKNLQTRSGARIQLIPQHLPEGDVSKGRTVRITGNKKQIESAREMIKEVMNQVPSSRLSQLSGGYTQHTFRPRGPTTTLPPWGARAATPTPTQPAMGYDHQPRGSYPPQTAQYPPQQPQPYGGYSQQPPARSGSFGTGWGQERPAASVQSTPHSGGYDYYAQGGQATNTISSSNNPMATAPSSASAPINYNNYGQSQAPGYGHPTPYSQTAPAQQNYGHGYNEPKYDQAPSQQIYGQQPGVYGQQASTPQQGYTQQQPYGKPGYGQEMPKSYGPSRESQQGDQTMYQSSMPSSYGSSTPTQQSYPYGSGVPSQPAPAYGESYGPTSGVMDGYNQQLSSAGYPHQGGQGGQAGPGYGQGGQPVPAYTQPGTHSGVYGQYPSSQPSYGDQPVANNVNYGYQGGASDPAYGSSIPSSGYGALPPVSSQSGYVQPPVNPSGYYEQSAPPQSGYSAVPGSAPVGYAKSSSPQPGYGGPYDSVHMYGQH